MDVISSHETEYENNVGLFFFFRKGKRFKHF